MRSGGARSTRQGWSRQGRRITISLVVILISCFSDGEIHLDTPFSRLLGKAPIMVAGMTPTTVKAGFVSAILSAGYHVELAGGGHYNPTALRAKVTEIQSKIPPGVGLTLNSLYINPRQFGFQFPLWQEMRREGLPIEGFCVAAGIPSTEKAAEIIGGLRSAGIKHVSFKPGSVEGIRQVVSIAAANPDFPIILQWTGGRAGGHHSYEDFHMPILKTYGSIRQHDNLVLVGGSGFGGADDLWPYLTGDWSKNLYDTQPMPFDGFLFASRVMVAREAHTSSSVKDLIVAAAGVDNKDWENTYVQPTGGVLTVRSELGEPIHKIATRAVTLWKEFDNTVFNLPKEKRAAWLAERKVEVIDKLNKDFAKPWFGWKKDGRIALDLGDMTYEEVTLRMIRLMYVAHQDRWIDHTLRNLTGDWLRRVEERFAGVDSGPKLSILQSFKELDSPSAFVDAFFTKYPDATRQLLAAEDRAYFLTISQRPGQKPAPFIPILDANFEVWFKKVRSVVCRPFPHLIVVPFRILCGLRKIFKLCSTRILSACAFCRALSPLNIQRSRTNLSENSWGMSPPSLWKSLWSAHMEVIFLKSLPSTTSLLRPKTWTFLTRLNVKNRLPPSPIMLATSFPTLLSGLRPFLARG